MALKQLSGAVAVITGGASGIGLATGKALYTAGAHIVLADINETALQQAGQLVREENPTSTGQVILTQTDVTSEEQVEGLMREALSAAGRIDLVVTSAGIGRGGPIELVSAEEMQALLNINFMGTYNAVRAALPTMRQQQGGHFVLLSSAAGKLGAPFLSGYCATKWAIRGFSSALRAELYGQSIGVTTVYPSWVETPMTQLDPFSVELLHIKPQLTATQVAQAILEAVQNDQHDLTLVPEPETARIIELMQHDPEQAEQALGASFQRQLAKALGQNP